MDDNSDGYFEGLVAEVEVEILSAGEYVILSPGGAVEVIFHKFHPYSNIDPWNVIEPIFTMRGIYQFQVIFKNNYPCAWSWFDETSCAVWTGEVASNAILVEVE